MKTRPVTGFWNESYARLDGSNQPFTGNLEISKVIPELKLIDTSGGNYTRLVLTDSDGLMSLKTVVMKPGGLGNALNFRGTDEYVSIANESNFDFEYTQPFSIATWFQHTADEPADPAIIAKQEKDGNRRGYGIYFSRASNKIVVDIRTTINDRIIVENNTAISDGVWYSAVFTYDGSGNASGVNLYVNADNSSMTTTADNLGGGTILNNIALQIAGRDGANRPLHGLIDEPAVWDRELTAGEASDYHKLGIGLYLDPANNFPSSGISISINLKGIWHLDESSGTNVADSSGNSNTGTTHNMEDPADWVPGKVLLVDSNNEINVISAGDGIDSMQGYVTTIGDSTHPGEIIFIGDEQYWKINGTTVMGLDNNGTLILDNRVPTAQALILRGAVGQSKPLLEIQDSNGVITSEYSVDSIKLMANAVGDITCFEDGQVANDENGKFCYFYRNAPEGLDYIRLYVDEFRGGHIEATTDLKFDAGVGKSFSIGSQYQGQNIIFGSYPALGENPYVQHRGWITGAGRIWVQWQLNDTTDYFELTRFSADILGFDIRMPLHVGDGTNYTAFASNGLQTMKGTARVTKEIIFKAQASVKGASAPTDALRAIGASGDILMPVVQFSKVTQQDVHGEFHLPCDIDNSIDIEFHLMWIPGASWTAGNYVWELEYLVKDEDSDMTIGVPTTISMDVTPSNATDMIETKFSSTIDANADQIIFVHFYRDIISDNGDDVGEIVFFEVKYTSNKLGEAF